MKIKSEKPINPKYYYTLYIYKDKMALGSKTYDFAIKNIINDDISTIISDIDYSAKKLTWCILPTEDGYYMFKINKNNVFRFVKEN